MIKKFISKLIKIRKLLKPSVGTYGHQYYFKEEEKDEKITNNVKKFTEMPEFIRAASRAVEELRKKNRFTKWVLLAGPAYGDEKFKCSVLIETKKLLVWAVTFGKAIKLRNQNQLRMVRDLSSKISDANTDDETVQLIEESLREILLFYVPNFQRQNYLTVFCPSCLKLGVNLKVLTRDNEDSDDYKWCCECDYELFG